MMGGVLGAGLVAAAHIREGMGDLAQAWASVAQAEAGLPTKRKSWLSFFRIKNGEDPEGPLISAPALPEFLGALANAVCVQVRLLVP